MFPISSSPIKNGFIETLSDGSISDMGQLTRECESTLFYNGVLFPKMVEIIIGSLPSEISLAELEGKLKDLSISNPHASLSLGISPGIALIDNIDFRNMKLTKKSTITIVA